MVSGPVQASNRPGMRHRGRIRGQACRLPQRIVARSSSARWAHHEGDRQMTLPGLSLTLALAGILAPTLTEAGGQASKITAPETITENAHVAGSAGAVATRVTMQIDRYTPEAERNAVADALKHGGYPGFLTALRKAPVVGTVTVAGETFDIRWARDQPVPTVRSIGDITETRGYCVGRGSS